MTTGKAFAGLLETQGYDFFTGVPCSLIEGVIGALEAHPRLPYIPAVREDVAVGLAAGYESAAAVTSADEITGAVERALGADGPHFVLARVTAEERPAPRIPYAPEEIRDRFRAALGSARGGGLR